MDKPSANPPKLLDLVRNTLRQRNYAYATEKSYLDWIERYILFHKEKLGYFCHPKEMGPLKLSISGWRHLDSGGI